MNVARDCWLCGITKVVRQGEAWDKSMLCTDCLFYMRDNRERIQEIFREEEKAKKAARKAVLR